MKNNNNKKVLLQGNIAICEGAIAAGCFAYFAYPITPQNEISAYMARRMPELNRVFLQSESEIAAINMVFGAALTGCRAMTTSSSPGISLMQEGISYLCGCELPCVIANIVRGGPGLGNISGSQADYFQTTKGGGHGDYRLITLAPDSVQEMYDLTYLAFDLADKYRNPVMILSDGYTAQMMEPIEIKNEKLKIKNYEKDWILDGCKNREPRKIRSLFMGEGELEKHNWKLNEKYNRIKQTEQRVELYNTDDAEIIIVAQGIAARISKGAVELGRKNGLRVGLIRPITLWPFTEKAIRELITYGKVKKFLVVELNLGQMIEDVKLSVNGKVPVEFLGRPGGTIFTPEEIYEQLKELCKK
ncbi:MAG: 3-methyl-2-oxobutanoate dehydrogenase subunit VorB [Elusimicrobiota bacterium]|nr:3-methyl-2-oxobutanoate dehydrogenase subunit VorB [Elusimicrobiota bacterium]